MNWALDEGKDFKRWGFRRQGGSQEEEPGCGWRWRQGLGVLMATVKEAGERRGKVGGGGAGDPRPRSLNFLSPQGSPKGLRQGVM